MKPWSCAYWWESGRMIAVAISAKLECKKFESDAARRKWAKRHGVALKFEPLDRVLS